jgi:hypothetical protein
MRTGSFFLVLSLALPAACGLRNAGSSASFERSIGTASRPDAMERGLKVVAQYQFDLAKEESDPELLIETHWRKRDPFEDEVALGIAEAETRLIIVGRRRGNTAAMGANYDVNLTIENRVRPPDSNDWSESVHTSMFKKYADDITAFFKRELQIGVRRY